MMVYQNGDPENGLWWLIVSEGGHEDSTMDRKEY